MLNYSVLQGRLTRDPELRKTTSGKSVINFTLAVGQDIKQEDGSRGADFIDCVAWGSAADFLGRYFHKGDMVVVSGRLQKRTWSEDDGSKHSITEVNAVSFYFCQNASYDPSSAPSRTRQQKSSVDPNSALGQAKQKYEPEFSDYADDDGDLPF